MQLLDDRGVAHPAQTIFSGEKHLTQSMRGIVDYEPTELVMTARAGTSLAELESALEDKGQMLAFEPPHFGANSILGGLHRRRSLRPAPCPCRRGARSGAGGAQPDGNGTDLRFGGQVMKNVAGFDVSRLMAGSMGTLGVIREV